MLDALDAPHPPRYLYIDHTYDDPQYRRAHQPHRIE